jgi:hypothetical protein
MTAMNDCDGCKWWSERIAQAIGNDPMEAMCLNIDSPKYNRMVHTGCKLHTPGRAIDDPCFAAGDQTESYSIYDDPPEYDGLGNFDPS